MELILTLDVGTTSVKACLFDRQLRQTALTSREYALQTRGVCAEVEAQVYLDAAAQCILSLPAEARARVCAVALTTQGETLLCVDRQGKALRPAIVWLDSRAEAQAARLAAVLDRQRFYERTGLPELSGALPLAKLLWLREQEPESWARTDKFLLLEDYLMLWLTGRAVTEKSLLTSTGYFDLQSDDYWDEALTLAGLDRRGAGRRLHPPGHALRDDGHGHGRRRVYGPSAIFRRPSCDHLPPCHAGRVFVSSHQQHHRHEPALVPRRILPRSGRRLCCA